VVLSTGEILFSRWNNTTGSHISLFRVTPSGVGLSPLYGFHTRGGGADSGRIEFTQAREMDDGALLSLVRPFDSDSLGGNILQIDAQNYAEFDQPTWSNQGMGGSGHIALTDTDIRTDGEVSPGGQFASVYPLRDGTGRSLVSWSQCRVIAEDGGIVPCTLEPDNTQAAPPLYGGWVYDPAEDTQRPIARAEEGFMISEVIAAEPRAYPSLFPQPDSYDAALAMAEKGQLLIDSVYDFDGADGSSAGIANHARPGTEAFRERPARFLRVLYPVPIPDDEVFDIPRFASGVAGSFSEIAGYVPVEPDGSVTVSLPANRAFRFSVLGEDGRRIGPRHNYWLQLGAGEVLRCPGCHIPGSGLPHGRLDSQPLSSNPGARSLADGGSGFPGTDTAVMFASEPGQTMAQTWDYQRFLENVPEPGRALSLTVAYRDEWTAPGTAPDPDIDDRDYDPGWIDIPAGRPIVVDNLDPTLPGRIVINYIDHIQPIWERVREPVTDASGLPVDNCLACHNSQSGMAVAAGQLDLDAVSSDIDPDHMRSYHELLSTDAEQWLDSAGNISDRQRICTELDEEGNVLTSTISLPLAPPMRAGSANASSGFFDCFEGGFCGLAESPPLPDNCTEEGGTVIPRTANSIDHRGMLSAAELRLISEWLDIGAQYYNNPFDQRLQ
jgi:hypothetical protein